MTSLIYSNRTIFDMEFERILGKPALGRTEVWFFIKFKPIVNPGLIATANSIRAIVSLNGHNLGPAIPVEKDFLDFVHPDDKNPGTQTITFSLVLDHGVMEKVEEIRGGQDICFQLAVTAIAKIYKLDSDRPSANDIIPGCESPFAVKSLLYPPSVAKSEVRCNVPQSEWVKLLSDIGYLRTLLYEIPFPRADDENIEAALSSFNKAMELFIGGDYGNAVGECRKCLDAAARDIGLDGNGQIWNKTKDQNARKNMSIQERYVLMWESIRHIAHVIHHESPDISREEAHYLLGMTAIALSMASRSPCLLKTRNTSESTG